jgi:hypothetical protein
VKKRTYRSIKVQDIEIEKLVCDFDRNQPCIIGRRGRIQKTKKEILLEENTNEILNKGTVNRCSSQIISRLRRYSNKRSDFSNGTADGRPSLDEHGSSVRKSARTVVRLNLLWHKT